MPRKVRIPRALLTIESIPVSYVHFPNGRQQRISIDIPLYLSGDKTKRCAKRVVRITNKENSQEIDCVALLHERGNKSRPRTELLRLPYNYGSRSAAFAVYREGTLCGSVNFVLDVEREEMAKTLQL